MDTLTLLRPSEEYASEVMAYRKEMLQNGDSFDGCAGLETVESYAQWADFENRLKGQYGDSYAPTEVFLAIR